MNQTGQHEQGPLRGVRTSDEVIEEVLNKLDRGPRNPLSARRAARRLAYREAQCVINVTQPGSTSPTEFTVPTRDLSTGGIGFLHGGFIHIGSKCHTRLRAVDDSMVDVPGVVVRCEYIERMIHQVSVKFDEPIDPGQFCSNEETLQLLLIDGDEETMATVTALVESVNAELDTSVSTEEILEKTSKAYIDCILIELDTSGTDMFELVRMLRSSGYARSIVAVTELTDEDSETRALEAGCDTYFKKPYTDELIGQIATTLRESATGFRQRAA